MNAKQKIQNTIESNDVFLFMKCTPDMPQFGFSMTVANVLKMLNIKFDGVNVSKTRKLETK